MRKSPTFAIASSPGCVMWDSSCAFKFVAFEKEPPHILPIVHAPERGLVHVVRRRIQNAFAAKVPQVADVVVDHIIRRNDALIAAENNVARRNVWEISLQPVEFRSE